MIIQYASDLHLEFPENKEFLIKSPLIPRGDILLLSGDILPFGLIDSHNNIFEYFSDHFEKTFWIPGNHEYYHFDLAQKSGVLNENIKSNVHLVNDLSTIHNNVRLIFSTMWTKISSAHQWEIEQGMNDFQLIRYNDQRFSSEQYNQIHNESLRFIASELNQTITLKTVVATHHVPTLMNYPEKYRNDALNEAFAVELHDMIETMGPDYWIYGHHHNNTPDFNIGETQLLTNQLGYVKYGEHQLFDTKTFIII